MGDQYQPGQMNSGNGPRFDYSAAAAAEILNLHFDPSQPKELLYERILGTILRAMDAAADELNRGRTEPSDN